MPTCKTCGKRYSVWTAQWGKGQCNPCIELAHAEVQAEARKQNEADAKVVVKELLNPLLPEVVLSAIGAASWKTTGDVVGNVVSRALLGPFLSLLGGAGEKRAGFLAVSEQNLYLIYLGQVIAIGATEAVVTAADLRKAASRLRSLGRAPTVDTYSVETLRASVADVSGGMVITIKGPLSIKALFPSSFSSDNVEQGRRIANAINARVTSDHHHEEESGQSRPVSGSVSTQAGARDPAAKIVFTCTSCQGKLQVRPELGGKRVKCPKCGSPVKAPELTP